MDCGALWVEGADARIRATIAHVFGHEDGLEVSMKIAGDSFGNGGPNEKLFFATVLRCTPGANGGKLTPVASALHQNGQLPGDLRFSLPVESKQFQEFRYHIYLARTDVFGNMVAKAADPTQPWGENLLINPSFEYVDPADPTNPYGWYLDGERKERNFKVTTERRDGGGDRMPAFIRLQTVGPTKSNGSPPAPRVSTAENIPLKGGTSLRLTASAWIRSATGNALRIEVRFRDQSGARVGSNFALESEMGKVTDSYQDFHAWGVVPDAAVSAQLVLTTGGSVGVTDVANISLQAEGMEATPKANILSRSLEEGARIAVPLVLAKGGTAQVFDLGPIQQKEAAAFTPLHGAQLWGADYPGGWTSETPLKDFEGALPEALSRDGVLLEPSPLRLQIKPGSAWVWLLIGSPGDAGVQEPVSPTILVEGKSVSVPTIPYTPIQYHLERDDDAVNDLRTRQQSIFNSYILPRYTQVIVKVESPNDAIEVACPQGQTCPLVAAGVFQGVDENTVNKTILGIHEARRQAFEQRWARGMARRALKGNLPVSQSETERGFLPFVPEPGISLLPHDVPSREMVTKAMNGLVIQVAPGSRALFRLGVYPLKFRRQGQLSLSEPISQLGEPIKGADWRIRSTRYRATKDHPKGSSYRLTPDLVVQEDTLSIRPGITRTIWVDSEIPETAQPGEYVGAMRLQAGRNRFVEIPVRIEVLPFPLPVPIHGHGTSMGKIEDLDYGILRYVNALSVPLRAQTPDQLIPSMEALVKRLGELGNSVERIFLTPELPLVPETLDDWVSMLEILRETGDSRKWPKMVLVASALRDVGFKNEHLRYLCSKERWTCASVSTSKRPRRRDRTEEIQWLTEPALNAFQVQRSTEKKRNEGRESWLFNVGCGRAGKGLISWAMGLSGSLCISGTSARIDPLDTWSSVGSTHPIDHVIYQGRILETERFLMAQEGLLDARYLNLMERIVDKGKKQLPSQLIRNMSGFMRSARQMVSSRSKWEWRDGVSLQWPAKQDFRAEMVAFLKEAWNGLQQSQ